VEFSIVIPTYERMDVLPEVLAAVEDQADAPAFEVVVVDDGSGDGTGEWLRNRTFKVPARIVSQPNQGPAAARNLGVRAARGRRVAFLGDDTVPSAGWLASHARAHRERPEAAVLAVIGYTGWHPRMRLTPFLRYVNEYGLQFGYALIDDPEDVPFNFLYTSNLSLPRSALLDEPFDLGFPYPAWEDIELSYRMKKKDLRLIYVPEARVAHDHPTDLERFARRQEKAGYCAVVFYQRHPELGPFLGVGAEGPPPPPSARRQRWLEKLARALQYTPLRTPRLWEEILRYHYIQGLHRGWRDRVSPGCGTADQADARKGD
jgi:glycosyltransferase involved in cell wall biosynthesis